MGRCNPSKGTSMTKDEDEIILVKAEFVCSNFDEDCEGVENKVKCWLYEPECGLCPFLYQAREST